MENRIYEEMFWIERNHWWFATRREIILALLEKFLESRKRNKIVDVGCGTGALLGFLEKYGEVYGFDASPLAVEYAGERGKGVVQQGALPDDIPFGKERFDLITAIDVLEHVQDDVTSLKVIYRLLNERGIFVCTVPAFRFLWSGHDKVHHHFRRYTRRELKDKLLAAGFEIRKISYYNTLLFPPIAFIRLVKGLNFKAKECTSDARLPPPWLIGFLSSYSHQRSIY